MFVIEDENIELICAKGVLDRQVHDFLSKVSI